VVCSYTTSEPIKFLLVGFVVLKAIVQLSHRTPGAGNNNAFRMHHLPFHQQNFEVHEHVMCVVCMHPEGNFFQYLL
jgi:hypothetical protein